MLGHEAMRVLNELDEKRETSQRRRKARQGQVGGRARDRCQAKSTCEQKVCVTHAAMFSGCSVQRR